jgi:hypothetical protein
LLKCCKPISGISSSFTKAAIKDFGLLCKKNKVRANAGIFLHTDGTGKDHFASKSTDWHWFGHYWQQIV